MFLCNGRWEKVNSKSLYGMYTVMEANMEEKVTTNFIGSKRKNDWIVKIKSYISLQCWLHYIVKGYHSTQWSDYTTEKEKKKFYRDCRWQLGAEISIQIITICLTCDQIYFGIWHPISSKMWTLMQRFLKWRKKMN